MAITNPSLIQQYSSIHKSKRYGQSVHNFTLHIQACIIDLKADTVLEYGCGQSRLFETLAHYPVKWVRYDPAIPELATISMDKADLIVNTDVMEHIPESDLDDVLSHMRSLSPHVFFNISTRVAKEVLPNGDNAHCTVWSPEKWLEKLQSFFPDSQLVAIEENYACTLITWDAPVKHLLRELDLARIAKRQDASPLKRLERRVREMRNRLAVDD